MEGILIVVGFIFFVRLFFKKMDAFEQQFESKYGVSTLMFLYAVSLIVCIFYTQFLIGVDATWCNVVFCVAILYVIYKFSKLFVTYGLRATLWLTVCNIAYGLSFVLCLWLISGILGALFGKGE